MKYAEFTKNNPGSKWHYLYYAIGLISFLVIVFAFSVIHSFVSQNEALMNERKEFSSLFSHLIELKENSGLINQPGNDIFKSGNVALEQERLKTAEKKFKHNFTDTYAFLIKINHQADISIIPILLEKSQSLLKLISKKSDEMIFTTHLTLEAYQNNDKELATVHMANMNQIYISLDKDINQILIAARNIEDALLLHENSLLLKAKKSELIIFFLLALILIYSIIIGKKTKNIFKLTQKKLLDYQHSLQARVLELENAGLNLEKQTIELKIAKEKADESLVSKGQFLASISHEIRTPMNAIIGFAKLLKKSKINQAQLDKLKRIEGASEHLLSIINDILDFSKIDAGKMQLEHLPFSVREEVKKVASLYYETATEKGLRFFIACQAGLIDGRIGDALRFRQIIMNLIGNALKFTKNGHILLEVFEGTIKNEIKIVLSDTGIGISKEQQEKLFKPFSQADSSTTRQFGGTGLGLTISKQLVEFMHGRIELASEVNKGTSFTVFLNLEPDATQKPEANYANAMRYNKKILVALDNKKESDIVINALKSRGIYALYAFKKGTYDYLKDDFYAVIISDTLYFDSSLPSHTPIILITNNDEKNIKKILANHAHADILHLLRPPYLDTDILKAMMKTRAEDGTLISPTKKAEEEEEEEEEENKNQKTFLQNVFKCLLVEDNENNQILAQTLLEEIGLIVTIANNGFEAVEKLKTHTFNIVLMDMQMPVMDGVTATRKIRGELQLTLPILAMTANIMQEDQEKCFAAGMNAYISKPIHFDTLNKKIAQWLNQEMTENVLTESTTNLEKKPDNKEMILDIDSALKRIGNKKALYFKILDQFIHDYAQIQSALTTLLNNNQREEAQRYAHTLKGIAATVGAIRVEHSAKTIEEKIKTKEPLDSFNAEIMHCQTFINEAINERKKLQA